MINTIGIIIVMFIIGFYLVDKFLYFVEKNRNNSDNTKRSSYDQFKQKNQPSAEPMSPDHYSILGLLPTATPEEVHSAYKLLIRQYHPDKVATLGKELQELAERKSKEINVAYQNICKDRRF